MIEEAIVARFRIITIDGPAGAGKSSVARRLAAALGYEFLDTGAMYRAVTWRVLEKGIDPESGDEVAAVARATRLDWTADGELRVDGQTAPPAIRGDAVSGAPSAVSANPGVRDAMVAKQRAVAESRDLVAEGRDTGSVVFPDADVRFYLDAAPAERARRRAAQMRANSEAADEAAILAQIERRDLADSTRPNSPLCRTEGMDYVDTTGLAEPEVVELLRRKVHEAISPA